MFNECYGDGCVFLRYEEKGFFGRSFSLLALRNTRENRDLVRGLVSKLNDIRKDIAK